MTATGWIGEDDGPAMPVTSMLLGMRQRGPGDTFAAARFRADAADAREARAAAANAPDPDERAANLVAAGYAPGAMFGLSQQLADTNAELESEREKIARGERRAEHVRRDLAAGRVGALEAARRLDDGDFGDVQRAQQLERRAASIRSQITDAAALISPPAQRPPDDVEAAASRARQLLGEVTRARATRAPERPPFAGRGAAAEARRSTEHTGPDCWVFCAQGRKRDAERAAREGTAYAPGTVITRGYEPGVSYR